MGLGEGGQGMGDKGCWTTTTVAKMEKSSNRDWPWGRGGGGRKGGTKGERRLQRARMGNGPKTKKGEWCVCACAWGRVLPPWASLCLGVCARQGTEDEEGDGPEDGGFMGL